MNNIFLLTLFCVIVCNPILNCKQQNHAETKDVKFLFSHTMNYKSNYRDDKRIYFRVFNKSKDTLWLEGVARAEIGCRIAISLLSKRKLIEHIKYIDFQPSYSFHAIPPDSSKLLFINLPLSQEMAYEKAFVNFKCLIRTRFSRTNPKTTNPSGFVSTLEGEFTFYKSNQLSIEEFKLKQLNDEYPNPYSDFNSFSYPGMNLNF